MKTKPFDLQAAMDGAKLVTRGGREAKFIAYVPVIELSRRLLVLIDKIVWGLYDDGKFHKSGASDLDLFLAVATRSINGHEYPEPEKNAPPYETPYWYPAVTQESKVYTACWNGGITDMRLLRRGLVHLTREAAEDHARAIILAGGGEV